MKKGMIFVLMVVILVSTFGLIIAEDNPATNSTNAATLSHALQFQAAASKCSTDFSLSDLLLAPQKLYAQALASPQVEDVPFAFDVLKGLYNGHLQTSFYQAFTQTPTVADWLAAGSYLDWKFLRSLLISYAAANVIYIPQSLLDISSSSLSSLPNYTSNQTAMEYVMANPTQSVIVNNQLFYIGSSGADSNGNYAYMPVLPVSFN